MLLRDFTSFFARAVLPWIRTPAILVTQYHLIYIAGTTHPWARNGENVFQWHDYWIRFKYPSGATQLISLCWCLVDLEFRMGFQVFHTAVFGYARPPRAVWIHFFGLYFYYCIKHHAVLPCWRAERKLVIQPVQLVDVLCRGKPVHVNSSRQRRLPDR